RFLQRQDLSPNRLYGVRQVHSRVVEIVDGQEPEELRARDADGLLTTRAPAVLSVTVADCLPIYLADRTSGAFGIVHSGWRGTGIVSEALSLLASRFGCRPRDVQALIGPGIGPCCYSVPPDRAELFSSKFGADTVIRRDGVPHLDLRAANVALLTQAGVEEISVVTDCTSCTPFLGSFRRQGPSAYTLMLAWIGRRPPAPAGSAP
ncbi:MAG TPA: polyphenol oxidase family protein, partial [Spirochaetia bacterium]|nr:polyphenol oxidase family protein [Spirochaetia bacterium]